ncbi:MAG: glutamate racemase [Clostridiales bacterium]|nr:glutamate racemase [Clostridiales bacterium]
MNNAPIGIFDSGVGGLTVLGALRTKLPRERFVYVSDARSGGWGSLPVPEIVSRVQACVELLHKEKCKLIVAACNTATSVCIETLRKESSTPFVGVEPAIKPAREAFPKGRLLLLCTPATARTERVRRLLVSYGGENAEVFPLPTLASDVEKNFLRQDALTPFVEELLRAHPCDAVILGCTHYSFLRSAFEHVMGKARVFDGTDGVARRVAALLSELNLPAEKGEPSILFRYIGTDGAE